MLADLWPIVSSVLGVFLVIGIGAACRRAGWLSREADYSLANLTAKVLLPSLFADRILSGDQLQPFSSTWFPPVYGYVSTTIGFLIGLLVARQLGHWIGLDTASKQRTFAFCAGICNYGYIPLPLADRFYPDAMVDLILHNVGVDMALWSVGIAVLGGGSGWKRGLLSAPVIAVVIASALKASGLQPMIPESLFGAIRMLGSCSIPMGLLLSGAIIVDYLQEADWRGAWRVILASIGVRQFLLPVLMLLSATVLASWTPVMTRNMSLVVMLEAAMPSAIFPIVLVRLYQRDTSTALRVVLSTSLAGVLLIPIWIGLGKWWLGLW